MKLLEKLIHPGRTMDSGRFSETLWIKQSWQLIVLWLVLNICDIYISWVAVQSGAIEVGIIWQITGSWSGLTIYKMLLALLAGWLLVRFRKARWLILLNIGIFGICIYNVCVLIFQINV